MSNRNWAAGALGVVTGVGIALLFLVWAFPGFRNPNYQEDRYQRASNAVIRPSLWETYTTPTDTYAQWIAAIAAFASVGVSIWAVRLVGNTLVVNRRATEAAEDAVAVTREMGEIQTRAYLTVTGGAVVYFGSRDPQVYLKIRNAGNSPAFDVVARYQRSNATVFNSKPTGKHVEGVVTSSPIAVVIPADSEAEYLLGAFGKTDEPDPGVPGAGFNVDGLLEYQTVFDRKSGNIDTDSTYLLLFGPSRAAFTKAMQEGKELRLPMQLMPQFSSGWIVDYRRIVRSAREHERSKQATG
ncbi:hypothetical protein [Mesorhizobium captivum]|uniref:hypothetical protein n=1 Tax=Mesorhizobium captivum TaxID=3072319 RepID=UPI002A24369D|nr:hypothetical protein [Mesorhizobium sp. VK3C]MDX8446572.1 hypothetical protein [Mesorhizobium sp. VK3C]